MDNKKTINKNEIQTFEQNTETSTFSQEDRALYQKNKKKIKNAMVSVKNKFIEIASSLYPIYEKKLYKIENYSSIYAFADDCFNISRGTCNEFLNVCKRFCSISEDGQPINLLDDYKDYSLSQLRILQSVKAEDFSKFSSDMTVREMKQKKKEIESPLLNKTDISETEHLDGTVEITIPPIFEHEFNSYEDLEDSQEELLQAWKDIKKKKPSAKLKFVIDGIEV